MVDLVKLARDQFLPILEKDIDKKVKTLLSNTDVLSLSFEDEKRIKDEIFSLISLKKLYEKIENETIKKGVHLKKLNIDEQYVRTLIDKKFANLKRKEQGRYKRIEKEEKESKKKKKKTKEEIEELELKSYEKPEEIKEEEEKEREKELEQFGIEIITKEQKEISMRKETKQKGLPEKKSIRNIEYYFLKIPESKVISDNLHYQLEKNMGTNGRSPTSKKPYWLIALGKKKNTSKIDKILSLFQDAISDKIQEEEEIVDVLAKDITLRNVNIRNTNDLFNYFGVKTNRDLSTGLGDFQINLKTNKKDVDGKFISKSLQEKIMKIFKDAQITKFTIRIPFPLSEETSQVGKIKGHTLGLLTQLLRSEIINRRGFTGNVTKSIRNYRSDLEKAIKELGKNMKSTSFFVPGLYGSSEHKITAKILNPLVPNLTRRINRKEKNDIDFVKKYDLEELIKTKFYVEYSVCVKNEIPTDLAEDISPTFYTFSDYNMNNVLQYINKKHILPEEIIFNTSDFLKPLYLTFEKIGGRLVNRLWIFPGYNKRILYNIIRNSKNLVLNRLALQNFSRITDNTPIIVEPDKEKKYISIDPETLTDEELLNTEISKIHRNHYFFNELTSLLQSGIDYVRGFHNVIEDASTSNINENEIMNVYYENYKKSTFFEFLTSLITLISFLIPTNPLGSRSYLFGYRFVHEYFITENLPLLTYEHIFPEIFNPVISDDVKANVRVLIKKYIENEVFTYTSKLKTLLMFGDMEEELQINEFEVKLENILEENKIGKLSQDPDLNYIKNICHDKNPLDMILYQYQDQIYCININDISGRKEKEQEKKEKEKEEKKEKISEFLEEEESKANVSIPSRNAIYGTRDIKSRQYNNRTNEWQIKINEGKKYIPLNEDLIKEISGYSISPMRIINDQLKEFETEFEEYSSRRQERRAKLLDDIVREEENIVSCDVCNKEFDESTGRVGMRSAKLSSVASQSGDGNVGEAFAKAIHICSTRCLKKFKTGSKGSSSKHKRKANKEKIN